MKISDIQRKYKLTYPEAVKFYDGYRQALLDAAEVVEKKLTRNGRLGKDALDKADIASKNIALFELLDELRQMAEEE